LSHQDLNLYLFRRPIMQALVRRGWKVTALVPDGSHAARFQADGICHVPYQVSRRGMNPAQEAGVVMELRRILRGLAPDLVHTFTMKPNIYGTLAARMAGVTTVANSVTGLGSFFVERSHASPMRAVHAALYRL